MNILEENEPNEEMASEQQKDEISAIESPNEEKEISKRRTTTRLRKISECVDTGKQLPPLIKLFGQFFHRGEITILCGDTGVGKSILAVQIAKAISEGKKIDKHLSSDGEGEAVCYYDFELGDRQFYLRYPEVEFNDRLIRGDLNPDCSDCVFTIESIKADLESSGAKVIVIDNITALTMRNTADPDQALKLMKELKELQAKEGLSILILSHTPKIPPYEPIHVNHVGGSKAITNFTDSVFFISKSRKGSQYRYLKQVKSRNEKELDGVVELILESEKGLFFRASEINSEQDHIEVKNQTLLIEKAKKLKEEGKNNTEIAKTIGVNKSTIGRWLK